MALLIFGIQKLHKIISAGDGKVKINETSNVDGEERITLKNSKKDVVQVLLLHPKSGDHVICKYDDKVWVAFICSYDEVFDDFKDKFWFPSGYNTYYCYPEMKTLAIWTKNVLKILAAPSLKFGT